MAMRALRTAMPMILARIKWMKVTISLGRMVKADLMTLSMQTTPKRQELVTDTLPDPTAPWTMNNSTQVTTRTDMIGAKTEWKM
jgi:hypothetical protein